MKQRKKRKQNKDIFVQIQNWVTEYKTTDDIKTKKELKKLITLAAMPFVKKIALGLARQSQDPFDDIIQVGALGLIKAINFYDEEVSPHFKSYATYLISGEIKHYLRDKSSVIRPPREIIDLSYKIKNIMKSLKLDYSEVTAEMISDMLEAPIDKIKEVLDVSRKKKIISLDEIMVKEEDGYVPLVEKLPSADYSDLFEMYETKVVLKDALNKLDDRLKETITLIYFKHMTQKQVSEKLNISQMQVSRRLHQAFDDLYKIITRKSREKTKCY